MLFVLSIHCEQAEAQTVVKLVDLIPSQLSDETYNDSEPSLAIDPTNPQVMVASALTPAPPDDIACSTPPDKAPIYISTDGGTTWELRCIIPSDPTHITADITVRHGSASDRLYAAILKPPRQGDFFYLNILGTGTLSTASQLELLEDARLGVDQPMVQSIKILAGPDFGKDRALVASNDMSKMKRFGGSGRTATVDYSLDPATASPSFVTESLESRDPPPENNSGVRTAVHADGTVYALFYRVESQSNFSFVADVVVVRDDSWGTSSFTGLNDGMGVLVADDVTVPWIDLTPVGFGYQRLIGSSVAITVDPNTSDRVFIVWADNSGPGGRNALNVYGSNDRGENWGPIHEPIAPATNPALAVNVQGTIGLVYQKLTGDLNSIGSQRWETHFEHFTDDLANTPSDLLLANTRADEGHTAWRDPYLGDYLDLVTLGKDFHGVFSTSNRPIGTRFPQGVSFQRGVDSGTLRNEAGDSVAVSIDPFYFHVQELPPAADYFVSDWVDDPSTHDNGAEPSTHRVFYSTSDVWNRRTDSSGGFDATDRAQSEDPIADADNFAFARLRRKAAGSVEPVTLRFLIADFGTGNNFMAAGSDPEPVVTFGADEVEKTLTNGYRWLMPQSESTHLCLAVEISSASDPLAGTSLLGRAPGWPNGDLVILNDNNRAQRNLRVEQVPESGIGCYYAIIHNAAVVKRDITLHCWTPLEGQRTPNLRVVGGSSRFLESGHGLVLDGMEPGENRWIRIDMPEIRAGVRSQSVLFEEMERDVAVNGFGLEARIAPLLQVAVSNLALHRALLQRVASSQPLTPPLAIMEATIAQMLQQEPVSMPDYLDFMQTNATTIRDAVAQLVLATLRDDPFALVASAENLRDASPNDPARIVSAHTALLQGVDAFLTMLEKRDGDPADILQNIVWQRALFRRIGNTVLLPQMARIAENSDAFIQDWYQHRVGIRDYPRWMSRQLDEFRSVAVQLRESHPELETEIQAIQSHLDSVSRLQGAHRRFLLHLRDAVH